MKKLLAITTCSLLALGASAADFTWINDRKKTANWKSFGDSANWAEGTHADYGNPNQLVPGDGDSLYNPSNEEWATYLWIDLDGQSRTLRSLSNGDYSWATRYLYLRNGSLTFTENFDNTAWRVEVTSGARLTFASTSSTRVGRSTQFGYFHAQEGGEISFLGVLQATAVDITAEAGGTITLDPSDGAFSVTDKFGPSQTTDWIANYGTLNIPHDLTFGGTGGGGTKGVFHIRQYGGTLNLGGRLLKSSDWNDYDFTFAGGTIHATGNASISSAFKSIVMTAGATGTAEVDAEKTLDLSTMTFEADTALTKTGAGTLALGAAAPATLNVTAGTLALEKAVNLASGLTLAAGTTLRIDAMGIQADAIAGLSDATVVLSDALDGREGLVFAGGTAQLASDLLARLVASGATGLSLAGATIVRETPHASTLFSWKNEGTGNSSSPADYSKMTFAWYPFCDGATWLIGADRAANTAAIYPQADDDVYLSSSYYPVFGMDMGGAARQVRSLYITGAGNQAGFRGFLVRNGSLEFTHSFTNVRVVVMAMDGGTFRLGANSGTRLGFNGAQDYFTARNGGTIELGGDLCLHAMQTTVEAGGRFVLDPKSFSFEAGFNGGRPLTYIRSSGTVELPNGWTMSAGGNSGYYGNIEITQSAGTLVLGGPISRAEKAYANVSVNLGGGLVRATGDVSFPNVQTVAASAGAALTFDVAAGKTLDVSTMSFGAGVGVMKTGGGALTLQSMRPATLAVEAGSINLDSAFDLTAGVTFAAGTHLAFNAPGSVVGAIAAADEMTFSLNAETFSPGAVVVCCADATTLETIHAKLGTAPAGFVYALDSDCLTIEKDPSLCTDFTSTEAAALKEATGWSTGSVPAGLDVRLTGNSTVGVLDAETPTFKSISVTAGATLKIVGEGTVVPPLELGANATVLIAAGANVVLTNGFAATASRVKLPRFELESGATVDVGSGRTFKNVDLRLKGDVTFGGALTLGGAAANECVFIGLEAEGARFIPKARNSCTLNLLVPVSGGRITAPNTLVLKDCPMLPDDSAIPPYTACVGYGNPSDEAFTLQLDNSQITLGGINVSRIGGGATIECLNGGGLVKPNFVNFPGNYCKTVVSGRARIILDGDGSAIRFNHDRYGFSFEPDEDGYEQVVVRNGASVGIHDPAGTGKAVMTFENGWWDVMRLCNLDLKNFPEVSDARAWMTNAFHGLKQVNVPAGKYVGVRASDTWKAGQEWDREIVLDPDVPICGAGSLVIANETPGRPFKAILTAGDNTATGEARVFAEDPNTTLYFANGANWAGTVVADGAVALTNIVAADAPAHVSVNTVNLTGALPIRIWNDGETVVNDTLAVGTSIAANGGLLLPVIRDEPLAIGARVAVATVPTTAPSLAGNAAAVRSGWTIEETESEGVRTIWLKRDPVGLILLVK